MGTRVYHVIGTCHENVENEEQVPTVKHELKAKGSGEFEMSAHTHRREDGRNEIQVKGKMVLKDDDYYKYIEKYGHHFNEKLSKYVIEHIESPNSKISQDKVEEILKQSDEELEDGNTLSDLHYVANMIKARHSSATVKSDAHVVMLAVECLNDPNKSEGEIFCEWFDKMARKNKKIPWKEFI